MSANEKSLHSLSHRCPWSSSRPRGGRGAVRPAGLQRWGCPGWQPHRVDLQVEDMVAGRGAGR